METLSKTQNTIELLFILTGPTIVLASIIINSVKISILSSENLIFYRLLQIYSILAFIVLGISLFIPISQCRTLCQVSSNNLTILIYEYYLCLCFGCLITHINLGISILASLYRVLSIKMVRPKLKFNIRLHVLLVIAVCSIVISPWFIYKEIVIEDYLVPNINKSTKYTIKLTNIASNKLFHACLVLGPGLSILAMISKIVLDSFTIIYFKNVPKKRKELGKLTEQEVENFSLSNKNLAEIEPIKTKNNNSNTNSIEKQIYEKILTLLFLLICNIFENINNIIIFYLFYNYTENMENFKLITIFTHICFSLNYLFKFFVHYCFDIRFRERFNRLFFCILKFK